MKRYLILLVIREMQIETILSLHTQQNGYNKKKEKYQELVEYEEIKTLLHCW